MRRRSTSSSTGFFRGFTVLHARGSARIRKHQRIVHVTMSKAMRKLAPIGRSRAVHVALHDLPQRDQRSRRARRARAQARRADRRPARRARGRRRAGRAAVRRPEQAFRRLETTRLIQVALDQLPVHYGNALEWKYVYGFSVEEIAAKLGLGLDADAIGLARAKRAFQDVYGALTKHLIAGGARSGRLDERRRRVRTRSIRCAICSRTFSRV